MAGTTLFEDIQATSQEQIDAAVIYSMNYAPMAELAFHRQAEKGHDSLSLPFVTSTAAVETYGEDDDTPITSTLTISSRSIEPVPRLISFRVPKTTQYRSQEELISIIGQMMGQEKGEDMNAMLHTQVANFGTAVGSSGTDASVAGLRGVLRELQSIARTSGGPSRGDKAVVVPPIVLEHMTTDLGVQGVVASTSPWIPRGLSEDLLRDYVSDDGRIDTKVLRCAIFLDTTMEKNGAGDYLVPVFPVAPTGKALYFGLWFDWETNNYDESDFVGVKIRGDAYYNGGVGPYPAHGAKWLVDGD